MRDGSDLYQVVYCSAAKTLCNAADIERILATARTRNAALDVTGVLLYGEGSFLQVLEGTRSALEDLLARIESDPRHGHFTRMLERPIAARQFPDWRMGFRVLDAQSVADLPGVAPYMDPSVPLTDAWQQKQPIFTLLRRFRDLNAR